MPIVPAICPNCGGQLEVNNAQEAAVCKFCGTPFIVEKAINNFTTVNNITAQTVNIINKPDEFEIWEGCLEKYKGSNLNVVVPDGVTAIGDKVFMNSSIKRIILPDGLKIIGECAFFECKDLIEVKLPSSLVEIGNAAFRGCVNLLSIKLPKNVKDIGCDAFSDCVKLTDINIPESLTSIKSHTFSRCINLTAVTLPRGLKEICCGAFEYCSGLTSIVIPDGVTVIEDEAFNNCTSLTDVTLPKSVLRIGSYAFGFTYSNVDFEYNQNLSNITLPTEYSAAAKFFDAQLRLMKRCRWCGGDFTGGLFKKSCTRCGRKKDY